MSDSSFINNFHADLQFGLHFEKQASLLVHSFLNEIGKRVLSISFPPANVKFSDYDFKAICEDGECITFEVKTDRKAKTTGNFFIETTCNNKKSGVYSTRADYYVLIIPAANLKDIDECFFVETNEMKSLLPQCRLINTVFKTSGYLLPHSLLNSLS